MRARARTCTSLRAAALPSGYFTSFFSLARRGSLNNWKMQTYIIYRAYNCNFIFYKLMAFYKRSCISAGKKLKCPFCERLYGYETNLRAHIRQRHQGIRVPCPFCSRTFTRNNTVRRHIAREHKTEVSYTKALQQSNHSVSDTLPQ